MTRTPAVSVLLPVRDAEPWLEQALASLASQTFADFEVLIQDDGSTDASVAIAARYAADDGRFRLEHGPSAGIVSALTRARARARARVLARMDADDVSHPDRLARLVAAASAHPDVGFFASQIRYFPRDGLTEGLRLYEAWINGCLTHEAIVRDRLVECPMPHPAWMVRAEAFDALGGYRAGDFPEDYDLFLRAVEMGVRFHKVAEVLLDWRDFPTRASRTDTRYALERFRELKLDHLVRRVVSGGEQVVVAGERRPVGRWIRALQERGVDVVAWLDEGDGPGVRTVPACAWARAHVHARAHALAVARTHEDRTKLVQRLAEAGFREPERVTRLA